MKKYNFYFSLFISMFNICSANANSSLGADYKDIYNQAEGYFIDENYTAALPLYLKLDSIENGNSNVSFKIGYCYLNAPTYKKKSIPYFEDAIINITKNYAQGDLKEKAAPLVTYYYLAKAYHLNYEFDKAIAMYEKYKETLGTDPKLQAEVADVNHDIETCKNGKEFVKTPKKVTITNLGKGVNTAYPDYSPVVSLDEQTMIFTSRRKGGTNDAKEPNGLYYEDIYISRFNEEEEKWDTATSIGTSINTYGHEATVNLSADGQKLLIFRDDGGNGNLYLSELNGAEWTNPQYLGANINTPSWETHACFTADNRILYFISDRPGGKGGRDIYKCLKLPNGEWGPAQNLGDTINTKYDEDGVFIHPDGKQISFASKGHNSMGGFDIFTSFIDDENGNWTAPQNMGYPVNTPDDDVFLITTADGKRAFFSSDKEGGFGEKDIYMITLPEYEPRGVAALIGKIVNNTDEDISNNEIKIIDKKTGEEIQVLNANGITGKYGTTLTDGRSYKVSYSVNGKEFFSEIIEVPRSKEYQVVKREIPYGVLNHLPKCDPKSTYEQFFKYNEKGTNPESKNFQAFVSALTDCLKANPSAVIEIESSASYVPTKKYKDNKQLAKVRAEDAKMQIIAVMERQQKVIKGSQLVFSPSKLLVQGPKYKKDPTKASIYEPYQYIKIRLVLKK
ncbi:MAG: OmpA family protein [Bacteroidota bacterium]